jgi:tripartite-type tricarboxylate transporter receptor subunit TctC
MYRSATSKVIAAALLTAIAWTQPATAADYPNKPIRIIVPFSPGGSTDLIARGLATHLSQAWKQPVIVENKLGAGGTIALNAALNAPADGYTFVVHSDGFVITPVIFPRMPYDAMRDFRPVALLARAPNFVTVGAMSPYKSLNDLVQAGKISGKLSYATAGVGSGQHMQAAKFTMAAGLQDPVHIPHKGTPESLTEVVSGRVDFVFAPAANALPLIKSGKLRPLAVSTLERSSLLPDVPTVNESGVRGFNERQWWGLFVGAKVPADIVRKLENETRIALKTPAMQQLIVGLSSTPGDLFGKDFTALVSADLERNRTAARIGKITAE